MSFFKEKKLVFIDKLEVTGPKPSLTGKEKTEVKFKEDQTKAEKKELERHAALESTKDRRTSLQNEIGITTLTEDAKKEALKYTKEYKPEQIQSMLKKSEDMPTYQLWRGGSLRRKYEKETDPAKKADLLKQLHENQGYAEMTAQFASVKYDENKKLYLEVNLYNKSKFEDYIGAGHICPPEWVKVAVIDTKGETKIGFRKIPGEGGSGGSKIGYYTQEGEYICVYSGYKIYPLEIKSNEKQADAEEQFYNQNRQKIERDIVSPSVPKKTEVVKANEDSEKHENSNFVRSLTLFTTSTGEKYYHTVARAKEDPPNGVPRDMDGRWNEQRIIEWGKALEAKYGIPAVLVLTIAHFESGRGANRLSYELGNYFGIKPWTELKRNMRRIAQTKYSDHKEYGDFKGNGPQDHEHFADAWSSFVRYAELMSQTGRYGNGVRAFRGNPMMIVATQALSGYCPSRQYIKTAGQVMQRYGSKYGFNIGRINYPELMSFMKSHNPEKLSVEEINSRLLPAKQAGFVDGMPD